MPLAALPPDPMPADEAEGYKIQRAVHDLMLPQLGAMLGNAVPRVAAPVPLTVAGRSIINREEAGRGTGADVLGEPHNALAWLANHLGEEGNGLHAVQIVLTGSLVKTVWLDAGDIVKME